MAYAAVELAASRLGEMSPVLVHGPSGVGKSHLLAGYATMVNLDRACRRHVLSRAIYDEFPANCMEVPARLSEKLPSG